MLQPTGDDDDGEAGVSYEGKTSKVSCFLLVCVIVTLAFFVIAAVALAVALGVLYKAEGGGGNDCLTVECANLLTNVVTGLDQTVDPCEDFYQFSCGNWISNTEIPIGVCIRCLRPMVCAYHHYE